MPDRIRGLSAVTRPDGRLSGVQVNEVFRNETLLLCSERHDFDFPSVVEITGHPARFIEIVNPGCTYSGINPLRSGSICATVPAALHSAGYAMTPLHLAVDALAHAGL
jgi:hypothetical protein